MRHLHAGLLLFAALVWPAAHASAFTSASFRVRGRVATGTLAQIGAGASWVNEGAAGTDVPVRFGFGFARGDMPSAAQATASLSGSTMTVSSTSAGALAPGQWIIGAGIPVGETIASGSGPYTLSIPVPAPIAGEPVSAYGNTIACRDNAGTALPCQLDQIADRDGLPGASDTGGFLHAVVSLIEPRWAHGATRTFRLYSTPGVYSPGAALTPAALTAGHDYQVRFANVKDATGNIVGSGNFTCDLNAAIAAGPRTAAGGYDITYAGQVETTIEALAPCTDNATGAPQGQLAAEFWPVLWQTSPGSGVLGNIELAVRLEQPWQDVCPSGCSTTGPAPKFVWGDAQIYDAATATVLRAYSRTTAFAPADVTLPNNAMPLDYLYGFTAPYDANGNATISGATLTGGSFFAGMAGGYVYITGTAGCTSGGYQVASATASAATLLTSPGSCTGASWRWGGGTIANYDGTEDGEALTVAATNGGTLPRGLAAGQLYFAQEFLRGANVPGPLMLTRNAQIQGAAADGVTIASRGLCPNAGSCFTLTRHTSIQPWTGAWLMADDKGHPFWIGSNATSLYPALTTAQKTYWETTGLVPAYHLGAGALSAISPYNIAHDAGGPLYRSGAAGPQSTNISGAGAHDSIGNWSGLAVDWFLDQTRANWDLVHADALTMSNAYGHVVLNNLTGYLGAYDDGPYPANTGAPYPKLGAPMPLAFNVGEGAPAPVDFSVPVYPSGLNSRNSFWYGVLASGAHEQQVSHEPDYGDKAAYLIGGEPWYLRQIQMHADYDILAWWPVTPLGNSTSNESRNFVIGGKQYTVQIFQSDEAPRGPAWTLRDLTDAAVLGGDSDPAKAYFWDAFRQANDGVYQFDNVYWAADPNYAADGILQGYQPTDSTFMDDYEAGAAATAHALTHYASAAVPGAGSLYTLNQAVKFLTLRWTAYAASGVCNYWASQEEMWPYQSANPKPLDPGVNLAVAPTMAGNADSESFRYSTVTAAGLFSTAWQDGSPPSETMMQNGDPMQTAGVDGPGAYDNFGDTQYYAIDVDTATNPVTYALTTNNAPFGGCAAATGTAGCPAMTPPSSGRAQSSAVNMRWRPQDCPAAPAMAAGADKSALEYVALDKWAGQMAQNAGATTPGLPAMLSGLAARYDPTRLPAAQLGDGLIWYVQPLRVP